MNKLINLYMSHGISLFSKGENVVLLPLIASLPALKEIKELNLIVLGGDVYKKNILNEFEHTYDSWYYDGHSSLDSILIAEEYLEKLNGELYISFIM